MQVFNTSLHRGVLDTPNRQDARGTYEF